MPDRLRPFAALAVVVWLAACSPSTTPTPGGSPAASSSSGVSSPGGPPGTSPCAIVATEGPLRSTKLLSVEVVSGDSGDLVLFHFGPDAPTSTNQPVGRLEAAVPPFSQDPSGQPLEVPGSRFVRVRFSGLVLYDASGAPTLTGSKRLDPAGGAAVRAVVQEGESEGVSSWLIGFDGAGCAVVSAGDAVTTIIRVEVVPTP
jgi:hypothetical protein